MGNVTGAKAVNLFLILKLPAVASIAVIGCFVGVMGIQRGTKTSQTEWFGTDPDLQRQDMYPWAKVGEYITAVFGALFCYGGWETVSLCIRLSELEVYLLTIISVHFMSVSLLETWWTLHETHPE